MNAFAPSTPPDTRDGRLEGVLLLLTATIDEPYTGKTLRIDATSSV
jgi:hypothetical protein